MRNRCGSRLPWAAYLLASFACAVAGLPGARAGDATVATEAPQAARMRDPATALAKRLDLNAQQTSEVRRLLVSRQTDMRALWTNNTVAAEDRVGAIKAINARTESQIRELLTEEQRKRYFQPKPNETPADGTRPSVEHWLNVSRGHP